MKGTFLNAKNQMIGACARSKDVCGFLLIGCLSEAMDACDDDETNFLMETMGDIATDNIDYTKYKIGDTVVYKPMQQYKRGKKIEMNEQEMKVTDVIPHAMVGDLSVEYKVCPINDNSGIYYHCHESSL